MLSLAKNDRGFRLAFVAIILLPLACLIFANSRSNALDIVVFVAYFLIASAGFLGFACECAELAEAEIDECPREERERR